MKTQKVWYVTGTSSGFGLEITKAALEAGDKVAATVRKEPEKLRESLNNHPDLLVVIMNVTDETKVRKTIKETIDHFGKIDVLVNNAGYGFLGAIEEATDTEVKQQYDTNVFGVLNVIRAALPYMRKQRSGHIINTSSLFAFSVPPAWALYSSTKFALEDISQGLAVELKPFNIKVTAIEPGLFTTDFLSGTSFKKGEVIIDDYENTPVGQARIASASFHGHQPGDPKKLAGVVVQLAQAENPPMHLPIGTRQFGKLQDKCPAIG